PHDLDRCLGPGPIPRHEDEAHGAFAQLAGDGPLSEDGSRGQSPDVGGHEGRDDTSSRAGRELAEGTICKREGENPHTRDRDRSAPRDSDGPVVRPEPADAPEVAGAALPLERLDLAGGVLVAAVDADDGDPAREVSLALVHPEDDVDLPRLLVSVVAVA